MKSADGKTACFSRTTLTLKHWTLMALCSALYIFSQFYRVSNAVIAPQLQMELSLSSESLGMLSASFFYVFALVQIPIGLCLDRVGARLMMLLLTLVGSMGALAFATAQGFAGALLGRMLLGLGMAGNFVGALKLFTHWFSPREFATFAGLLVSVGTLGNILAATPLALLVEAVGWRWAFGLMGGLSAVTALLFFVIVGEKPNPTGSECEASMKPMSPLKGMVTLLAKRDYWLISIGCFFRYGILVAIQGLWAGLYLIDLLGLSAVAAGNILLCLNLGLIVGSPTGGWLSDRVLNSRKWVGVLGMAGTGLALLVLSLGVVKSNVLMLACVFFLIGFFSAFGQVMYAHIKELVPVEMTGVALTGINLFTMLGGAACLHVMGAILDYWSKGVQAGPAEYQAAFFLAFCGVSAATVLYSFARDAKV